MKPMPELDALVARSKALGVFGTKERSVIHRRHRHRRRGQAAVRDRRKQILPVA
jgi:fructose-bisphosphate aldolase class 1